MPLPLAAASEVKATLAALKRDAPGTFAALGERITELRNDPGNPQLRGRIWRTVDNLTVRVPIVVAPDGSTWAIAWTVRAIDEVDTFSIEGLERVPD